MSITPDRRDIYITVNIVEGENYTVSEVSLAGQMLLPREELEKLIELKPGDVFSREKLAASTKAITDRLGNEGYAFANANAIPNIDKEKRTVAFSIVVDPGRRVYVRRIDVAGNTKTRDEVVRREMRQLEGAYYDASKIQLSRRRIDRTQFFSEVTVETLPVEGNPDQVDVTLHGEGKADRRAAARRRLLERGADRAVGLDHAVERLRQRQVPVGQHQQRQREPGLLAVLHGPVLHRGRRQPRLRRLQARDRRLQPLGRPVQHRLDRRRHQVRLPGVRADLGRFRRRRSSRSTSRSSPTARSRTSISSGDFGNQYTYGSGTAGWARDTRDSLITTTAGSYLRARGELAGGDLQYYRLGYQHQWYHPLTRTFTLHLGGEIGYAGGYGGKPLPFFKNFFAGGPGSVRGYRSFSLGPQDELGNTIGGNRKLVGTAEFLFPMPGAEQDRSLRLAAFLDGGQVYANKIELGELRYATGIALFWSSPFGPLRLSLAQPLNPQSGDRKQQLQFTFGTGF